MKIVLCWDPWNSAFAPLSLGNAVDYIGTRQESTATKLHISPSAPKLDVLPSYCSFHIFGPTFWPCPGRTWPSGPGGGPPILGRAPSGGPGYVSPVPPGRPSKDGPPPRVVTAPAPPGLCRSAAFSG